MAEEHRWRAEHSYGPGWYEPGKDDPSPGVTPQSLEAEQIATIYRALRKAREDNKDEPGAGDFYYGEMEMRRRIQWPGSEDGGAAGAARPVSGAERMVLWVYWLVSGYGLRAARALIALAVTILLGAVALDLWGFPDGLGFGRAVLFALESSISLLRTPDQELTAGGEVTQIVLRLAGPLFFGLALLSLRGRVKR